MRILGFLTVGTFYTILEQSVLSEFKHGKGIGFVALPRVVLLLQDLYFNADTVDVTNRWRSGIRSDMHSMVSCRQ